MTKMQKLVQPESKRAVRQELETLMTKFLAKGGKIKVCKPKQKRV